MDSNEVAGHVRDRPNDTSNAQLRKVALSSLLGTALEYYDFLLYSTMAALVFGDVFFPGESQVVSTIAAFGTLAVGYVARPLGGILFGHFGDRFGRKHILIVTMALMGVASFLIGLLPSYAAIGVTAPILLIVLRILQGVAVGGEWGGAALMVVEHSDAENRGKWSGIMNLGSPLGFLMSTVAVALVTLLPDESLQSWGWRIPFLFSALLVVVGLYVRSRITESPVFQEAVERAETDKPERTPLSRLIRSPRPVLLACAAGIAPFALTALMTSHIIAYATGIGYDKSEVIRVLILLSVVALVAIPLASTLSDRIGRRTVVFIGATGAIVFAFPLYMLINTGSIALMAGGLVLAQIFQNMMFAPLVPLLSEMFGTTVRYTGASLGYQGASLIGAGFTPLIASILLAGFGGSSVPLSLIIVITAGISIGALTMIKETRGRDLTTIDVESTPAQSSSAQSGVDITAR